uniref:Ig-like domain-containing protein n=1 Tax=Kryptolebias marmoratus TaxID=37003 RepID=A0A3Q3B6J7_KRYMA
RPPGLYLILPMLLRQIALTSSDPDRPGGSVSLQCSVLSDSDNKTCSGGLRVFWFRSRSDKSYPDIIYADGNRHDECEKKPDSQKRCVFSKNISSSDAESYYCAVATCGQIIFGKGIKIEAGMILCLLLENITSSPTRHENLGQPRDYIVSKVALLYFQYLSTSQQVYVTIMILLLSAQNEDGQDLNYVALRFSGGKSSRGKKKKELKTEESVYSHVKI